MNGLGPSAPESPQANEQYQNVVERMEALGLVAAFATVLTPIAWPAMAYPTLRVPLP